MFNSFDVFAAVIDSFQGMAIGLDVICDEIIPFGFGGCGVCGFRRGRAVVVGTVGQPAKRCRQAAYHFVVVGIIS